MKKITLVKILVLLLPTIAAAQCTNIALNKPATASATYNTEFPARAFDGNCSTGWTAPGYSGYIQVDLQGSYTINNINLLINQAPNGVTTHQIYTATTIAGPWNLVETITGFTSNAQLLQRCYSAAPLTNVGAVRISTTSSPSWVSWMEIGIFTTSPPSATITPSGPLAFCFGGSVQLTANAGGSYLWSTGQTTQSITVNASGIYSVTVTGSPASCVNGNTTCTNCSANASVTVTVNPSPSSTSSSANILCNGSCTGTATSLASGGTSPYSYSWSPSGGTSSTASSLCAGTYTCVTTDANSCTTTQSFNITAPPAIVLNQLSQSNVSCFGGNNGTASVAPAISPNSVSAINNNRASLNWTEINSIVSAGYSSGITFEAWVKPDANWTSSDGMVFALNTSTAANRFLFGYNAGLQKFVYFDDFAGNRFQSGTAARGQWHHIVLSISNTTFVKMYVDGVQVLTYQSTFPYSIPATDLASLGQEFDGIGVTSQHFDGIIDEVRIWNTELSPSTAIGNMVICPYLNPSHPNYSSLVAYYKCDEGSGTLLNDASPNNRDGNRIVGNGWATPSQIDYGCYSTSPGGMTYNWTPGNPAGDGTTSVTGLTVGTWSCTVTDPIGCTATQTFNITAPPALVANAVSQTNISCNGGSNGAASVTVSGGTTSYVYNWTPGNPTGDGTASVTGLTAGTWTCTVTDANLCTTTQTFNITAPSALVATSSAGSILCNGGTATVTVVGTGGTSPYAGTGSFTVTAGTYSYIVSDANGCTNTTSITVTEPAVLTATTTATAISCNGGTATVTVVGTGGTSPYAGTGSFTVTAGTYSYIVSDANGCTNTTSITVTEPTVLTATTTATAISCNGGTATVTVVGTGGTSPYAGTGSFTVTAGTYSYIVSDANGCTNTTSITVTEPTVLTATASATTISCNGGNATVTVVGAGGTAPYTGTGTFTVTVGTYSYTVSDANGCTNTTSITVTEPTVLTATASATTISCNGGNATVTVVGTGGTSPYTGTGTFTVTAGTYSYTVTDANGCTNTTSITITEPTALAATATAPAISCNGGTATVTVTGAGGTAPYTGEGSFTVTAGTYSYTVTDANGCTTTTSITISEPIAVWSIATPTHVTCFLGTDGNIDLNPVGGTPGYTFDWNNGQYTTEDLSGIVAGVYSVLITDANGCSYTDMVTVLEPAQLIATATSVNDPSGCGATNGSIDITVSGGTTGYTYLWNTNATTEDLTGVGAGAYSCVVTDMNGCTANVSGNLNDPNAPTVTLALTVDTLCSTDAAITLAGESPSGGTFSGTGVTAGSFDPTAVGVVVGGMNMISYTFTDSSGCTGSTVDSIYVDVCTGTLFTVQGSQVSIYPNPNNGTFTVLAETNSVLRIYDVTGNLIYNAKTITGRTEINLSEFANGVYVLIAETGENVNTQKIILNK